jgi:hypothetical protein
LRIQQAGDEFYRMVKQEEDRVDTIRAEEAFNKLRERQLDLTAGEENGFVQRKGKDAVTQPLLKDYSARFEEAAREIEQGLTTDRQRQLYRSRASVSSLQFKEGLLRHINQEGDVYAKQVYDGAMTVELRHVTARWQDPSEVGMTLERINGLINAEADRSKWSPEFKEAERLKRQSAVHSTVIQQALATDNYVFAEQWYKANKDDIDPATAKAVAKAVEDGTQKQVYADHTRAFLGASDSREALAALAKEVAGDSRIDDTRKNALLGRIQSRDNTLEARAARERDKLITRVQRAMGDVRSNVLAGFEPTAEQLSPILNAVKGTELEAEAVKLVQMSNATRAFRNSLPAAQEQSLAQAEAALRQDPTKFDRKLLEAWRSIHEAQKKRVNEAPITFAVQQGLVDPQSPAAQPLDLSNPASAAQGLAARFELGRAMQKGYGVPLKPMTPEETSLALNTLRGATVAQKREFFGALSKAAGNDAAGYSAIMAQLAPDDPITAIAGEYAGKGRTEAADLLLRGSSILRPNRKEDGSPDGGKLLPLPAETQMRRVFDDKVRDAFAGMPSARSDHYQAARAIYAAMSSESGDRDTSVVDPDRWAQAIKLATGGIEKYRGRNLVLPYGYEFGQFKDELARRVESVVERGTLGPDWTTSRLLDLPLEPVGDGRYVFRVGDAVLADGRNPVVVDFGTSAPFRTSGHSLKQAIEEPTPAELMEAQRPASFRAISGKKVHNANPGGKAYPAGGVRG